MRREIRVAIAINCLFAGACSAGPGASDETAHETLLLRAVQPTATAEADAGLAVEESVPAPVWGPCPSLYGLPDVGQECATISVPLDYRKPHGRQIDLAISRVRTAQPGLRRGVMLLNPGGPGAQGLFLAPVAALLFRKDVLDRYDPIGFDPRGAGRSSPISCGLSGAQNVVLPLERPGGFDANVALAHTVADLCGAAEGDVLPFMTSNNTVRDMDRIRQALGEDTISYWGASGGTNLGAMYASLFPGRTDRFVLDSAVDPYGRWREDWRLFGPAAEIRFPDLAEFLAANDATYHLGATPLEARNLVAQLIESLNAKPIVLSDGTLFNGGFLRNLTFAGLYGDGQFPFTAQVLQQVHESADDAASLDELFVSRQGAAPNPEVPEDNYASVNLANICGDLEWSRSIERYRAEYDADRALYPLFGAIGSNIHPCAFWPVTPIEPLVQLSASGPTNILIVQNLRDPATPHLGAIRMHAALGERSRMVSADQGGHGALFVGNTCVDDAAFGFLATGVLPASDQFCPREIPQAEFRPDTARAQALKELRRQLVPMPL